MKTSVKALKNILPGYQKNFFSNDMGKIQNKCKCISVKAGYVEE